MSSINPFAATPVSKEIREKNKGKLKKLAFQLVKQKKKYLKELKLQKKKLMRQLKKAKPSEKEVIKGLISQIDRSIFNLAVEVNGYAAEIIAANKQLAISQRMVKKMGYQTVEGYLNAMQYSNIHNSSFANTFSHEKVVSGYYDNGKAQLMSNVSMNSQAIKNNPQLITRISNLSMQVNDLLEENKQGPKGRR